ncbi:MAG TPA: restriction endonuclease [Verrucomicrobia bacterium]|jgi:type I restriction enzyme S subunit|nr:restriction endonuclease [Verrucomicrobiota bacterium]
MTDATRNLLEQHFDTAFAAPDGVAKLRELILTLAMQGKLVEQDSNDPPASELLKEIKAEKQRLVKAGKIKKPKPLPPIKPEKVPYELPQGWEWVRLIEIGSWALGSGLPHSIQGDTGQEILLCKVSDMNLLGNEKFIVTANNTVSEKVVQQNKLNISDPGTIIFPKIGGAIATNKRRILQKKTVIDNNCLGITPASAMDLEWCYQLLLSFDFAKYQTGTSVPAISQGIIGEIVIGLPPASEQHRIVARIDQLMARCEALEKLRKKREEKRLAVHAAAINQLLDPTFRGFVPSCETQDPFAFLAQHFGELYTVKENVAELRKAILQLAVMGRLVPQDPNDTPASELLKEIEAEKQRLVKAGIFRNNDDKLSNGSVCPFKLPQGWEWASVQQLGFVLGGKRLPKGHAYSESPTKYRYLTVTNMKNATIIDNDIKYISHETHEEIKKYVISRDDIYITIAGTIGAVGIIPEHCDGMNLTENASRLVFFGCDKLFLVHLLSSGIVQDQFAVLTNKMAQPKLSLRSILSTGVPVPPLAEQHRIVARIDQLMALCDTLDQRIDAATDKQTEILNSVMAAV